MMKPLNINLAAPKKIPKEVLLGFMVILVFAAATLSSVTVHEYMANNKVIKTSQDWIKESNKRRELKEIAARKVVPDPKALEEIKTDFLYLDGILKKTNFSLPLVLSEIEKIKIDQVVINEVAFTENLRVVTLKGQSNFVMAVSDFLASLDKSRRFKVELSKEEINGQRQISFELTLEWMDIQDGQKI
jgi:hypothetical protein